MDDEAASRTDEEDVCEGCPWWQNIDLTGRFDCALTQGNPDDPAGACPYFDLMEE